MPQELSLQVLASTQQRIVMESKDELGSEWRRAKIFMLLFTLVYGGVPGLIGYNLYLSTAEYEGSALYEIVIPWWDLAIAGGIALTVVIVELAGQRRISSEVKTFVQLAGAALLILHSIKMSVAPFINVPADVTTPILAWWTPGVPWLLALVLLLVPWPKRTGQ